MPEPGPGSRDGQGCPSPAVGGGGRGQGQGGLHSMEPLAWNVSARPGRPSTQATGGGTAGPEQRQPAWDYSAERAAKSHCGEKAAQRGEGTHICGGRDTLFSRRHIHKGQSTVKTQELNRD